MAKQLSDELSNLNRRVHQDWNQYRHEMNEALTGIETVICDNFPNLSPSLYREYTKTMRLLDQLEKHPEVKAILRRMPDLSTDRIIPKNKTISEKTSIDDIYSKFADRPYPRISTLTQVRDKRMISMNIDKAIHTANSNDVKIIPTFSIDLTDPNKPQSRELDMRESIMLASSYISPKIKIPDSQQINEQWGRNNSGTITHATFVTTVVPTTSNNQQVSLNALKVCKLNDATYYIDEVRGALYMLVRHDSECIMSTSLSDSKTNIIELAISEHETTHGKKPNSLAIRLPLETLLIPNIASFMKATEPKDLKIFKLPIVEKTFKDSQTCDDSSFLDIFCGILTSFGKICSGYNIEKRVEILKQAREVASHTPLYILNNVFSYDDVDYNKIDLLNKLKFLELQKNSSKAKSLNHGVKQILENTDLTPPHGSITKFNEFQESHRILEDSRFQSNFREFYLAAAFHPTAVSYIETLTEHMNTLSKEPKCFPKKIIENLAFLGDENLIPNTIKNAEKLANKAVETLLDDSFSDLNQSIAEINRRGTVPFTLTAKDSKYLNRTLKETLNHFESTRKHKLNKSKIDSAANKKIVEQLTKEMQAIKNTEEDLKNQMKIADAESLVMLQGITKTLKNIRLPMKALVQNCTENVEDNDISTDASDAENSTDSKEETSKPLKLKKPLKNLEKRKKTPRNTKTQNYNSSSDSELSENEPDITYVPETIIYSKFENIPKQKDEIEKRASKLIENGTASNIAEARVRIYRQDHVLKEEKTKKSATSHLLPNQDLRSLRSIQFSRFNVGPLRPNKTNDCSFFIGPKVDIMVSKGRYNEKHVNRKAIESYDSDKQLIQIPLIALSHHYLEQFQRDSEAHRIARTFCKDSKWNRNSGRNSGEAGNKSFYHHAVDTISKTASNMLSKGPKSQYDNPFLYLKTWIDLIDDLIKTDESDKWRNYQRETNDYAEARSLIERIKKISAVIDRPTESAEDSIKKYLELSMKQKSDLIIDYRDRFIYTIMYGFNLKSDELEKIDNYRTSRIQKQFIRGLTDKNFGNYFAQSLNSYTITTVDKINFVPMNAFLEALMSARAVYDNMDFTFAKTVNTADQNDHQENH